MPKPEQRYTNYHISWLGSKDVIATFASKIAYSLFGHPKNLLVQRLYDIGHPNRMPDIPDTITIRLPQSKRTTDLGITRYYTETTIGDLFPQIANNLRCNLAKADTQRARRGLLPLLDAEKPRIAVLEDIARKGRNRPVRMEFRKGGEKLSLLRAESNGIVVTEPGYMPVRSSRPQRST